MTNTNNNGSTSETTPWHIWHREVMGAAGIGVHGADELVTRERMRLWYKRGESVAGAADMVKSFVRGARLAAREEGDLNIIRAAYRASL